MFNRLVKQKELNSYIYNEVTTGNLIHDTILDVITSNTIGKKLFINMLNIKPLKEDMSTYWYYIIIALDLKLK